MEIILREAIHKTHFRGGLTEKAFLKAVSDYIRDATEQRLGPTAQDLLNDADAIIAAT